MVCLTASAARAGPTAGARPLRCSVKRLTFVPRASPYLGVAGIPAQADSGGDAPSFGLLPVR